MVHAEKAQIMNIEERLTNLEARIAIVDDRERINELIAKLNEYARGNDPYEYGLPVWMDDAMAAMREIVAEWIVGNTKEE